MRLVTKISLLNITQSQPHFVKSESHFFINHKVYFWIKNYALGITSSNFDVGIPILGTSILSAQIKKEEATYKGESITGLSSIILS